MKNLIKSEEPANGEADDLSLCLGRWMGRREAFGLVAGRCAAADIETLRQIREQKLYKQKRPSWAACCTLDLHVARRSVDREIGYLEEFGPEFFHIRQMAHIAAKEYRSIASHITPEGVHLNGTTVPLLPENSQSVTAAVTELLKQIEPKEPKHAPVSFDAALKRCQTVTGMLEALLEPLDVNQRMDLGSAVADLRTAAAGLGVAIFDRR
ncbi:MAG TPA: hypothetical protein VNY05_34170 [Candidatus Acidoferrales bacterium]|jgi:hypothetical protein|nr:hypothetical protein [Candidatus Acidoferrales bacterium]